MLKYFNFSEPHEKKKKIEFDFLVRFSVKGHFNAASSKYKENCTKI